MTISRFLNFFIAAVWLANGLFCKVLNLVPRHQEIVARIVGDGQAVLLTKAIGFAEMAMAFWVLSGYLARLNAIIQFTVIATMNVLEFIWVPDLLLWGRFNILFAFLFMLLILYNQYFLPSKPAQQL